jgi:hypothetical protein
MDWGWSGRRDTEADREPRWAGGAGKSNCDSLRIFLGALLGAEVGPAFWPWETVRSVEVVPMDSLEVS